MKDVLKVFVKLFVILMTLVVKSRYARTEFVKLVVEVTLSVLLTRLASTTIVKVCKPKINTLFISKHFCYCRSL